MRRSTLWAAPYPDINISRPSLVQHYPQIFFNVRRRLAAALVIVMIISQLAGVATSANAATYYVDTSTSASDSNPGTEARPWRSVGKVNGYSFYPGDRVLFRAGKRWTNTTLQITRSGTGSARITYGAYGSGARPVISRSSDSGTACRIENADYVTLQGLDIQRGNVTVVIYGSDHVIIDDCALGYGSRGHGVKVGKDQSTDPSSSSSYLEIKNSDIIRSDNGTDYPQDKSWGDGVALISGAQHCDIHHNFFKNWMHAAVIVETVRGGYRPTAYNKVHHNTMTAPDSYYCRGVSLSHAPDTPGDSLVYNKIYRNTIINTNQMNQIHGHYNSFFYNIVSNLHAKGGRVNDHGIALFASIKDVPLLEGKAPQVSRYNKVYNNVFHNIGRYGVFVYGQNGYGEKKGNEIVNNISINAARGLYINNHSSVKDNTYRNNLVFNTSSSHVYYRGYSMTIDQFNRSDQAGDVISDNLYGNPLFVDIDRLDFHIQDGSPVINSGLNVTFPDDVDDIPAVIGSARDIGVHEYGFSSGIGLEFAASPGSISIGERSILTWSTSNATSVTASGGWSGSKALSGSEEIWPGETTIFTLTATGPAGSQTKNVTVTLTPRLESFVGTMTIDGNTSDWGGRTEHPIDQVNIDTSRGLTAPSSSTDLSASFQTAWNDQYFFVTADVTDSLYEVSGGSGIWEHDGLEIMIDGSRDGEFSTHGHQVFVQADGIIQAAGYSTGSDAVRAAARRTGSGYVIEAAVAWSFIGGESPEPGKIYGFTIGVNDRDNGVRQSQLFWHLAANHWESSAEYGDLVLRQGENFLPLAPGNLEVMVLP
jgi:hypothetical protein